MIVIKLYEKITYVKMFNTKTSKTIIYEGNIDSDTLAEITEKLEGSSWVLNRLVGNLKSK